MNTKYYNKEVYDIMIIGGSLGSKVLCDLAKNLITNYKILLISGTYYEEYKNIGCKVIKYSNDILSQMSSSKIIICRGGGMTLTEAIRINKPTICIPSNNTKGNHQVINATYLDGLGCLKYFNEDSTLKGIKDYINNVINNKEISVNMVDNQKKLFNINSKK